MRPRRSGSLSPIPGRLADYDLTRGGQDRIRPDLPPMVAIADHGRHGQ